MPPTSHPPLAIRWAAVHPRMGADIPWPSRATPQAAGFDLSAALDRPLLLAAQARAWVPLGFKLVLPPGYEVQIRARSGLAGRHGIACLNAPGTIDADFRGELRALLYNAGGQAFEVLVGMRVAQMVVCRLPEVHFAEQAGPWPEDTQRGSAGFGSTGS